MSQCIPELLQKALRPCDVIGTDSSAYLALAAHCLFVQAGFESETDRPHRQPHFPPPTTWQGLAEHEWGVFYRRPGCCNRFLLRVASRPAEQKTLFHVTEFGNQGNIQVLGLATTKYAPVKAEGKEAQWQDLLANLDQFNEFVACHLLDPLLSNAVPRDAAKAPSSFTLTTALPQLNRSAYHWASQLSTQQRLWLGTALCAVAVAAGLVLRARLRC